jgi:hypothetical protein
VKITEAKPLKEYRLFVRFDDGISGVVDLSDIAGRGVFEAWRQDGVFGQVRVTEAGAVQWPGELDLCPDSLYLRLTGKQPEDIFPSLRARVKHA